MKTSLRIASLSLLTILCLALSTTAFADIYNNGPTNGTLKRSSSTARAARLAKAFPTSLSPAAVQAARAAFPPPLASPSGYPPGTPNGGFVGARYHVVRQ